MFFRRPKLTVNADSSSYALVQDALAQYHVIIGDDEGQRRLEALNMDDIDFIEAMELVENALHSKVDRKELGRSVTIADVVAIFDAARNAGRG